MKERVTLTIEKELLTRIDASIDNENIKNRSHAVELLLRKSLRGSVPHTAVILAGGIADEKIVGEKNLPKSMIQIQNKPVLLHNIELLKRYGTTNIFLAIQEDAEIIKEFFGDGSKFDVHISYIEEKEPLGTAGCLRILRAELGEPFIMMNGDELKNIDLEKLYSAHNKYQGAVTIALTTTNQPSGYGVALLDGNNILRFDEKPTEGAQSLLINAGLYIMEAEVTQLVPEGFSTLEHDIFPKLARDGTLFGYPFSGQWFDIKDQESLQQAEKEWKQ